MRYFLLACVLTFAVGHSTESSAKDSVKLPDEYRMIVCAAAVDVTSPLHELALSVVQKQHFQDPKFDDFIRQTLGSENTDRMLAGLQIETVQRLMPYCTLSPDDRVSLLLDQLGKSQEARGYVIANQSGTVDLTDKTAMSSQIVSIAKLVQHYQPELLAELKKRLDGDNPNWILVSAVNLLKVDGRELLPQLMKAAKSDDESLQYAAIDALNRLQLGGSELDSDPMARLRRDQTKKMAESMIRRYDKDGDMRLDASEWDANPAMGANADADQDGFITTEEYATYMESRMRSR